MIIGIAKDNRLWRIRWLTNMFFLLLVQKNPSKSTG